MKYLSTVILACALIPLGANADIIRLKKGGKLTGVIVRETEGSIEIRSNLGTITLSRGAIAEIERASEEDNKALEGKWNREKEERKENADRATKFEEEQRSKGLVKYKDSWVTPEKMMQLESGSKEKLEREAGDIEEQRRALEDMERRLAEMEARLERRETELGFREQQLTMREQNLLLQQQNLQNQAEEIARNRQQRPPKIFAVPRIEVVPPPGQ